MAPPRLASYLPISPHISPYLPISRLKYGAATPGVSDRAPSITDGESTARMMARAARYGERRPASETCGGGAAEVQPRCGRSAAEHGRPPLGSTASPDSPCNPAAWPPDVSDCSLSPDLSPPCPTSPPSCGGLRGDAGGDVLKEDRDEQHELLLAEVARACEGNIHV